MCVWGVRNFVSLGLELLVCSLLWEVFFMIHLVLVAATVDVAGAGHLRAAPDADSVTERPVPWLHFVSFGDEKYPNLLLI